MPAQGGLLKPVPFHSKGTLMSSNTASTATSTRAPGRFRWRVVDIVVAAIVAVVCGVVFVAWNAGSHVLDPLGSLLPGLQSVGYGFWLLGGPLAALIVRKPGAAVFGELVGAAVSMLLGAQWGLQTLESGLVQGPAAELAFAIFVYRVWSWPVAALSGALAGLAAGINDCIIYYPDGGALFLTVYIVSAVVSGAVIAGIGSWALVKGLARTGALVRFASGRQAERV
jgi:energy-coupling factor transport system substrate-specific component